MKKIKPLITVVIPTYNQSLLLRRAIQSVISQTFQKWELIIINNFSTDNTISIINNFKDERIKVFNFANHGVIAKSRNLGIKKAKSKYISFLDSDDFWYPKKLSKVYEKLENGYEMVNHNEDWFKYEKFLFNRNYIPNYDLNYKNLLFNGNCFSTSAMTVVKSKLQEVNGFNENKSIVGIEDYDLWLRLIDSDIKVSFIKDTLGIYYLHNNNFSRSLLKRLKAELIVISMHTLKFNLRNPSILILFIKRLLRLFLSIAKAIFN